MDQTKRIKLLSECGASAAALQAEHSAIEDALETLDQAVMAGAGGEQLSQVITLAIDFYKAHFKSEEKMMRDAGYADLERHALAHREMLAKLRSARAAIMGGDLEATLDAADLLNDFHRHVAIFDQAAHGQLTAMAQTHSSGA